MVVQEANRKKRVKWCKERRVRTVDNYWEKVMFSDGSQIMLGTNNEGCPILSDLCLQNEVYTVCSALVPLRLFAQNVPSRGICRVFAYRTKHTQYLERLFLRVAYVGSLLIERGIYSVQGACSFAWFKSDLCLKNNEYTVRSGLVPSRGSYGIIAYRTRHTQCVGRLFLRVCSRRTSFHSTTLSVGLRQLVHSCDSTTQLPSLVN